MKIRVEAKTQTEYGVDSLFSHIMALSRLEGLLQCDIAFDEAL